MSTMLEYYRDEPEPTPPPIIAEDPITKLARERFGIPFLFPFQRLAITNILRYAKVLPEPDVNNLRSGLGPNDKLELNDEQDHNDAEDWPARNWTSAARTPADQAFTNQPPVANNAFAARTPADQLIILPTGAGKSLCFALPAILLPGITLIIFPLLALMNDQARRFEEVGITSVTLRGGQSKDERATILKKLASGKVQCLLSNPETLQSPALLKQLQEVNIQHLVLDEAHIVSQWGDTFRPAYLELETIVAALKPPQITAFTATASDKIIARIQEIVFANRPQQTQAHLIRANPDRTNIVYHMIPSLHPSHDIMQLIAPSGLDDSGGIGATKEPAPSGDSAPHNMLAPHNLSATGRFAKNAPHRSSGLPKVQYPNLAPVERPLIIFCRSRRGVEVLASQITKAHPHLEVYFYHAGLERDEKERIEEAFFHSTNGILCATTAYGMGVDKKNIRTVIHYEPPEDVESYLQESGRGGRDRAEATAIMLYQPAPTQNPPATVKSIKTQQHAEENTTEPEHDSPHNTLQSKNLLLEIANTQNCRRVQLLKPLGGTVELCGGCDICQGTAMQEPPYQKGLAKAYKKYRKLLSIHTLATVLIGRWTSEIRMAQLYRLKEFGSFSNWSFEDMAECLELIAQSFSSLGSQTRKRS